MKVVFSLFQIFLKCSKEMESYLIFSFNSLFIYFNVYFSLINESQRYNFHFHIFPQLQGVKNIIFGIQKKNF